MSPAEGGHLPGVGLSAAFLPMLSCPHRPARALWVQLPAATTPCPCVMSCFTPRPARCQQLLSVHLLPEQSLLERAGAPCISLRLFTANPAASCALPGVTGSAGAHTDGSPHRMWPLERCGDTWGCVGQAAVPGAVAAAGAGAGCCCRQQSEWLVYARRRGLGLCAETLWREPQYDCPNVVPVRDPASSGHVPAHGSLGGAPAPSEAFYTAALFRSLKAVADVSRYLT